MLAEALSSIKKLLTPMNNTTYFEGELLLGASFVHKKLKMILQFLQTEIRFIKFIPFFFGMLRFLLAFLFFLFFTTEQIPTVKSSLRAI